MDDLTSWEWSNARRRLNVKRVGSGALQFSFVPPIIFEAVPGKLWKITVPSEFLKAFAERVWRAEVSNNHNIMTETHSIEAETHEKHMRHALSLASRAPPKPTNFCVGAILFDQVNNETVATGYTMELPGNTHAEQCCLTKYQDKAATDSKESKKLVLYTTMEPCNKRASGNTPCTDTILRAKDNGKCKINVVYVGVQEPEKFVGQNTGRAKLEQAGIKYFHVPGFEDEILAVATRGHEKELQP
ncbi:hypothetical protein ACLMJK_005341 [Lecanora helva]